MEAAKSFGRKLKSDRGMAALKGAEKIRIRVQVSEPAKRRTFHEIDSTIHHSVKMSCQRLVSR